MMLGKIALIVLAVLFCASDEVLAQRKNSLAQIQKIYLAKYAATQVDAQFRNREDRIISLLKEALEKEGFILVSDKAEADAVLSGTLGIAIVLDGPQPDPPQYQYEYQLLSAKNQKLWETKFSIRSRHGEKDADQKAAKKLAEKLSGAWRKSNQKR
jgi:hypothetical protein